MTTKIIASLIFTALSFQAHADLLKTTCTGTSSIVSDKVTKVPSQLIIEHNLGTQTYSVSLTENIPDGSVISGTGLTSLVSEYSSFFGGYSISYLIDEVDGNGISIILAGVKDLEELGSTEVYANVDGVYSYGDDGYEAYFFPEDCYVKKTFDTAFSSYCNNVGDAIEATFCEETLLETLSVTSCADSAEKAARLFHKMPTSWALGAIEVRNVSLIKTGIYSVEYSKDYSPAEITSDSIFMNVKVQEDSTSCGAIDLDTLNSGF